MNKAAYYKYSYWGVVQSTKYIIGRLEINFSIFIKKQENYINFDNKKPLVFKLINTNGCLYISKYFLIYFKQVLF